MKILVLNPDNKEILYNERGKGNGNSNSELLKTKKSLYFGGQWYVN